MKGTVFNIQRFSLDDGPGIRTVVFLQGCNLHCPWCHNPESYLPHPVVIRSAACTGCGRCGAACPQGLLDDRGRMRDRAACTLCGACVEACPQSARRICGQEYDVDELVALLAQDADYYRASNGGVTFSGGEPTLQWRFLAEVMERLRAMDIRCAIESNGMMPDEARRVLLDGLSFAMIDLKHSDPEAHRRMLGVSNEAAIATIRALAARMPVEVRTPVIPGFNDSAEALQGTIRVARDCGAASVRFLPYHVFGSQKHTGLDLPYRYDSTPPMERARVRELLGGQSEFGIKVVV